MDELQIAFTDLKQTIDGFYPIETDTWHKLSNFCRLKHLSKGDILYPIGHVHKTFSYVVKGLVRCYTTHESGSEYNKNFFEEREFPVSMVSLLTGKPSEVEFEVLEDCDYIEIDFHAYKALRDTRFDLMLFQINFLEKYWLIAKEEREINLIQDSATQRYLKFKHKRPGLNQRLPLYHIASHLGVTPTQLSRIRSSLSPHN